MTVNHGHFLLMYVLTVLNSGSQPAGYVRNIKGSPDFYYFKTYSVF
jgi:hypothetical protein